MDLFSVLSLMGGLAFFLFGMHSMSSSLEKWPAENWKIC